MRLKGYCYRPDVIPLKTGNFPSWPPSMDSDWITNPGEADFLLFPCDLGFYQPDDVQRLPYFEGKEKKHVFICTHDTDRPYGIPSIIFRCSTHKKQITSDPGMIPWPYPVDDLKDRMEPPPGGFKYSVSFHGLHSRLRNLSADGCRNLANSDIKLHKDFYGFIKDPEEGLSRRLAFLDSMQAARLALAPRGGGTSSYRFYEAMSMGRVPVLIADDHILPFEEEINYTLCSLRIPQKFASSCGKIIEDYLLNTTDGEILERGRYGRLAWEKYLDSRKWPVLMAQEIAKRI